MFTYIYMYLNVNVILYVCMYIYIYIYIYIFQPTPKLTKLTWREQVDRDVNIPPPPQTLKKKQNKWFRYQLPGDGAGY